MQLHLAVRRARAERAVLARWLIQSTIAVWMAWTPMLMALDHHGVERIGTHQHAAASDGSPPAPEHTHGFERLHDHVHAGRAAPEHAEATPSVTNPVVRLAAASFLLTGSLPPQIATLDRHGDPGYRLPTRGTAAHQVAGAPPAPPPRRFLG
jgi:hypothetical protein